MASTVECIDGRIIFQRYSEDYLTHSKDKEDDCAFVSAVKALRDGTGTAYDNVGVLFKDENGQCQVIEAQAAGIKTTLLDDILKRSNGQYEFKEVALFAQYPGLVKSFISHLKSKLTQATDCRMEVENGLYTGPELIADSLNKALQAHNASTQPDTPPISYNLFDYAVVLAHLNVYTGEMRNWVQNIVSSTDEDRKNKHVLTSAHLYCAPGLTAVPSVTTPSWEVNHFYKQGCTISGDTAEQKWNDLVKVWKFMKEKNLVEETSLPEGKKKETDAVLYSVHPNKDEPKYYRFYYASRDVNNVLVQEHTLILFTSIPGDKHLAEFILKIKKDT